MIRYNFLELQSKPADGRACSSYCRPKHFETCTVLRGVSWSDDLGVYWFHPDTFTVEGTTESG